MHLKNDLNSKICHINIRIQLEPLINLNVCNVIALRSHSASALDHKCTFPIKSETSIS